MTDQVRAALLAALDRLDSTSTRRGTVAGSGGSGVLSPATTGDQGMNDFNALVEAEVERQARQWEKTEERLHQSIEKLQQQVESLKGMIALGDEELKAADTDLKRTQTDRVEALVLAESYKNDLDAADAELSALYVDLKKAQDELRDALERADILTDTVEDQGATIGTLQREICQWQVRYAELEALTSFRTPADPDNEWADVDRQTPVEPVVAVTPGGDTP